MDDRLPCPPGLLEDRNGDGIPDYLNARIYVGDDAGPEELAAAANIAARLAFETTSLDFPVGYRIAEFRETDPGVAIVIGTPARRWSGDQGGVRLAQAGSRRVVAIQSPQDANGWARTIAGSGYADCEAPLSGPPDPETSPDTRRSLADLFTDPDRHPRICLGPDTCSPSVIDLAARIGLEASRLTLPLAVGTGSLPPEADAILVGREHPELQAAGVADPAPGAGLIVWMDSREGPARIGVLGGDARGESRALDCLARGFPYTADPSRSRCTLKQIEADVACFLSLRSPEGQMAAGVHRARQLLEEESPGPGGIRLVTGRLQDGLAGQVRTQAGNRRLEVTDIGVTPVEPIFEDDFEIEWEVDRARKEFEGSLLPRVTSGSRVDLEVRLSEPRDIRLELAREFTGALLEGGANREHTRVRVLSAFKQGYSWIEEQLGEALRPARSIGIQIRKLGPRSPNSIDSSRRWLEELYPIDEVLARDLGLRPQDTTFEWVASGPIYRIQARDASGPICLDATFEPTFIERPLFGRFPEYASTTVSTGWFRARVNGAVEIDHRLPTDPECFWDAFDQRGLEPLARYLLGLYDGRPKAAFAPHFGVFEVDVAMSEPDNRIGIDEERFSTVESLHEDIYFNTLLFIDLLGDRYAGTPLPYPGRIVPRVRTMDTMEPGRGPRVRLRLTGKTSPEARLEIRREKGPGDEVSCAPLRPRTIDPPRLTSARVQHGSAALDLTLVQPASNRETETEFESMLTLLAGLRQKGLADHLLSYPGVDRLRIGIGSSPPVLFEQGTPSPPPELADTPRGPRPIVPTEEPLDSAATERLLARLSSWPQILPFHAGRSWLGTPVWAVEVTTPTEGLHVSRAHQLAARPVLFVTGRQHGNEVSSTTHILMLAERLAADPEARALLDRVHFVLQPMTNPDGADLAGDLGRDSPGFMLHAGYFGCLGTDVTDGQWEAEPVYPESRVRRELWEAWQPDVVLDPHGYPSHEWVQLFGGYSGWFRSRNSIHRDWWIPRGAFLPAFDAPDPSDPRGPLAFAIRDAICAALSRSLGAVNSRMYARYRKYAEDEFAAPDHCEGIPVYRPQAAALNRIARHGFVVRRPGVTTCECTIELPDETARGEWLETLALAGVEASLACARVLAESEPRIRRTRTRQGPDVVFAVERERPIQPGGAG